jgi:hypothetical protein
VRRCRCLRKPAHRRDSPERRPPMTQLAAVLPSDPNELPTCHLVPRSLTAPHVDAHRSLTGVSCPSRAFCVAVDAAGNVVSSTHPMGIDMRDRPRRRPSPAHRRFMCIESVVCCRRRRRQSDYFNEPRRWSPRLEDRQGGPPLARYGRASACAELPTLLQPTTRAKVMPPSGQTYVLGATGSTRRTSQMSPFSPEGYPFSSGGPVFAGVLPPGPVDVGDRGDAPWS